MPWMPWESSELTLGDFERTGRQDCDNVIDLDDFSEEIRRGPAGRTARQIVDAVWKEWEEGGGFKEDWLEQQDDFEDLDPDEAYDAWRSGWKGCAVKAVERHMRDMSEENPAMKLNPCGTKPANLIRNSPRYGKAQRSGGRSNPPPRGSTPVLDGMAKSLWVTSFADWTENLSDNRRRRLRDEGFIPGPGGAWERHAPPTPPTAYAAARKLYQMFETANGVTMADLIDRAARADGRPIDTDLFGHYLAMQALGHGVSWFDDHATFPIKFVRFEAFTDDGRRLHWSPS